MGYDNKVYYFCDMNVELNINRLRYLLSLYGMEDADLLNVINNGLKRKYRHEQVFANEVDLKIIKKIDNLLFNKGLAFYMDPSPIHVSSGMSVFFRKKAFNDELNFTSKKVVNDYETLKNYLASLDHLSNIKTELKIPHCTMRTQAHVAAQKVRDLIYPKKIFSKDRDFLKELIKNLADAGIIVFEYLEAPNKKEKANIDGFFLRPNFIVLKRYSYYKREIFTLLHELGHYLLDKEEVESLDVMTLDYGTMSKIERWCNDFAYYFLVGEDASLMDDIVSANGTNDYHFSLIESISSKCFISKRALFTRLFYSGKLSQIDYSNIIKDLNNRQAQFKEQQRISTGEDGFKKSIPKPQPIYSPKFLNTLSIALHDGTVRPSDLYRMNIPVKVVEGLHLW